MNKTNTALVYRHSVPLSTEAVNFINYCRSTNLKALISQSFTDILAGNPDKSAVTEPPEDFAKRFEISSWKVDERNVFHLSPKENKTKKVVLFLHGGAYVCNMAITHWGLYGKLIDTLKCTLIVPDFPLASSSSGYKETFHMVETVYKEEVDQNNFILMGDSAGGGLALALAQKMKKENVRHPEQIILLSPWLDITCSDPEIPKIDRDHDPMLETQSLLIAAKAYAKELNLDNYLVSPINGEFEGLEKISVFAATHDIAYPDAKRLKDICDQKGIKISYFEYPEMYHDWIVFGSTPESEKAIEQIGDLINHKI